MQEKFNETFSISVSQGGFAKCYEMTDIKSDKLFAGKVIAKARLAKGNQKDKVSVVRFKSKCVVH
jgi:hypothetical protein